MPLYAITDKSNYIMLDSTGKYVVTTDKRKAAKWEDIEKANNVLHYSLGKLINSKFPDLFAMPLSVDFDENDPCTVSAKFWLNEIYGKCGIVSSLDELNDKLSSELSECDKIICDVEHKLEFNRLNACELCKCAKTIQDTMRRRRTVKNEMEKLAIIKRFVTSQDLIQQLSKKISEIGSRTYTPRVLNDNKNN